MSNEPQSLHDMTLDLLGSGTKTLALSKQPVEVQDAAAEYSSAVNELLQVGNDTASELAKLYAQRDLLPATGYNRLRAQVKHEAGMKTRAADDRAQRSLQSVEDHLVKYAQPQVVPAREALDREEFRVSLGSAEGENLVVRATRLALEGAPGAASILGTSFAKSMFAARNVENPGKAIADIQRQVAARGNTNTEAGMLATSALKTLGKEFGNARTTARMHADQSAGE
jgi:hypothetical protein